MILKYYSLFLVLFLSLVVSGQDNPNRWWNPAQHSFPVVNGKGWSGSGISSYHRLPSKAEPLVRDAVWNLSRNSAGLSIRFRSNSEMIRVRYQVEGPHAMPHMPATGVSGVDLYATDSHGEMQWCRGRYSFGDTITYSFEDLNGKDSFHGGDRTWQLFLPLYNSVKWLEIGVPDSATLTALPVRVEEPVVVYGTSIAQGGCASRPGMAWPAILERKLDRPVINLGFSGNGRLEKEVIQLINEVEAKLIVLDCLPNMSPGRFETEETYRRIVHSVLQIREKHRRTPVLLVDHAGYGDAAMDSRRKAIYTSLNALQQKAYTDLLEQGVDHLYYLSCENLHLDANSFVDGTHPTDLGMMQYASAVEQAIREILQAPSGSYSTTKPVRQLREPRNYDWEKRHEEIVMLNRKDSPEVCFLGNSIVHFWGGEPAGPQSRGKESWDDLFSGVHVRNMGFGWDRIENVLWRVNHDELDGFNARQILLKIGTNNLHLNSDEEIVAGLELLIQTIQQKQPESDLLVFGLLPRRNYEERIKKLNLQIARIAGSLGARFARIGSGLLLPDGSIDERLFTDGLHPNEAGYQKVAEEIEPLLFNF